MSEHLDRDAQFALGEECIAFRAPEKAAYWFRLAAEQDHIEAQYRYGEQLYRGRGTREEGIDWLIKAGKQGHSKAQLKLARHYHLYEDKIHFVHWLREAAECGSSQGQYMLGLLYYKGEQGIRKSLEIALHWFHIAAEQGHMDAQSKLGSMYFYGEGVAVDLEISEYWTIKAGEAAMEMLKEMHD